MRRSGWPGSAGARHRPGLPTDRSPGWSKNENLLAWRDGAPDVTAPDLICCFSAETGEPVTNPHHEPGAAVTVVGLPAAPQWRTTAGVATLGPRHFGFDPDYVPLEARLPAEPGVG